MSYLKIVFHCSDSAFGNAALITKWHVTGRGWSNIGYHYVILNGWLSSKLYNQKFDGHLETGRPLNDDPFWSKTEMGAHVKGHNFNSLGICLIGKSGNFTNNQLQAAFTLVYYLEKQFKQIELFQHSDLDKGKPFCAGLNMELLKEQYQVFKQNRPS